MICVVGTYSVAFIWSSEESSVELVLAGLHGFWVSDSDCQAYTASAWSAEPPCLSTHNAFYIEEVYDYVINLFLSGIDVYISEYSNMYLFHTDKSPLHPNLFPVCMFVCVCQ